MEGPQTTLIVVTTAPTTLRRAQEPPQGHLPCSTLPPSRPGTPLPRASPRRSSASCLSSWPSRAARVRVLWPCRRASGQRHLVDLVDDEVDLRPSMALPPLMAWEPSFILAPLSRLCPIEAQPENPARAAATSALHVPSPPLECPHPLQPSPWLRPPPLVRSPHQSRSLQLFHLRSIRNDTKSLPRHSLASIHARSVSSRARRISPPSISTSRSSNRDQLPSWRRELRRRVCHDLLCILHHRSTPWPGAVPPWMEVGDGAGGGG